MRLIIKVFSMLIFAVVYVLLTIHWKEIDWDWWQGCYFGGIFIFSISLLAVVFKRR